MNALRAVQTTRLPTLASLVGTPCAVIRAGSSYAGRGTLALPRLAATWLRPPELGQSLWFLAGATNWVRTTRVRRIETRGEHDVLVQTEDAQYRFVFARPVPVAFVSSHDSEILGP